MIILKMSELLKLMMKFCNSRKCRLSTESLHRVKTIQKGSVKTAKLRSIQLFTMALLQVPCLKPRFWGSMAAF